MVELGLFYFNASLESLPENIREQMSWISTAQPELIDRLGYNAYNVWLNWFGLHPPYGPYNPFRTAEDLRIVEDAFKTLPVNFWGTLFIAEEHTREHIEFDDNLNTTWFGEQLLGYSLYLVEKPTANWNQWLDEMFLRMVRGFYNYFNAKGVKVGMSCSGGDLVDGWLGNTWAGIENYYGWPAFNFIKDNYDFALCYAYTTDKAMFDEWTKQYFSQIDRYLGKLKKFWIMTRRWPSTVETWKPEAIELETHACLARNMTIMPYYITDPPLEETWQLILYAVETYTPTPPFGNRALLPAIIGGVLLLKIIGSMRR